MDTKKEKDFANNKMDEAEQPIEAELITQTEEHSGEQSAKDKIMSDGVITAVEFILAARYFLPVLATVSWLIAVIFDFDGGSFMDHFVTALAYIGWISALTVSPVKMIKFVFKCVAVCFKVARGFIPFYGIADLIAAVVGGSIGLTFSLLVLVVVPAAFTIPKFFNEGKF